MRDYNVSDLIRRNTKRIGRMICGSWGSATTEAVATSLPALSLQAFHRPIDWLQECNP
jgi:hypothetical protein